MASSCRSATRSTAIARRAQPLLKPDGTLVITACCQLGRGYHSLHGPGMRLHRTPAVKPFLEGREVVVFSPHLNDRDFRVSFAAEYRLFTTWEALSAHLQAKASRRRFGRGVPDGTSSNPELTLCLSTIRKAGLRRHAGSTGADGALSPLIALFALLIKLTSRGPVFYVQERIGKDGVPFRFIKFRTMVVGAETHGAGILCLKNDPRVTAVGRLLRRSSLDELPQLINVLRGEMSVIGPRPGLAYQVKEYTPDQRRRLTVLPGITGWAQVNGRNAITWDERIKRDIEYVERLSPRMDLLVLLSHPRGDRSQRYADRRERPFQGEGGEVW